ncbi:MAG: hypothetical protein QNJ84_07845 [Alphaproteobacteria bacterium]|nr:hypothetical protein [Alphaproteobacteria bacterium]
MSLFGSLFGTRRRFGRIELGRGETLGGDAPLLLMGQLTRAKQRGRASFRRRRRGSWLVSAFLTVLTALFLAVAIIAVAALAWPEFPIEAVDRVFSEVLRWLGGLAEALQALYNGSAGGDPAEP